MKSEIIVAKSTKYTFASNQHQIQKDAPFLDIKNSQNTFYFQFNQCTKVFRNSTGFLFHLDKQRRKKRYCERRERENNNNNSENVAVTLSAFMVFHSTNKPKSRNWYNFFIVRELYIFVLILAFSLYYSQFVYFAHFFFVYFVFIDSIESRF